MEKTYYIITEGKNRTETEFFGKALEAKERGAEVIEIQEVTLTTEKSIIMTRVTTYL